MNTITFEQAQGKWLDYTSSKVRCDRPEQLESWIKYVVRDGKITFDERMQTLRVDSEEQREHDDIMAASMQKWINSGGRLD